MLALRKPTVIKLLCLFVFMTTCSFITFKYLTLNIYDKVAFTPVHEKEDSPKPASNFTFPEIIWYKVGPKGLNNDSVRWMLDGITKNPTFRNEVLNDEDGDEYVKEHYASRPDIVETFLGLQVPILKADFLRYLLLFHDGGIWSDLDVSFENTPIHDWIPEQYKQNTTLVLGVEFDMGWSENIIHQFASWMIMAKPRSPHMMMVIEDILQAVRDKTKEHNVTVSELDLNMVGDVVDFTGPRRLTEGVMKSLNKIYGLGFEDKNLSHVLEPRLLGDVLVMPGFSFANSTNTYSGEHGPPLVKHHYAGTWKNKLGGEMARSNM